MNEQHATNPSTPLDTSNPPTNPEPTEVDQSAVELQLKEIQAWRFAKMTITANAANKMNLGNYSSADRGIFMSKEIFVDMLLPADKRLEFIQNETRVLQFMCEAQLGADMHNIMKMPGDFFNKAWADLGLQMYSTFIKKVRDVMGIPQPPPKPAAPPAA
jgi:hypothetical protein